MQDRVLPIEIYKSISYKKELKKLNKRYRSIDKDIKPIIEQLEACETPIESGEGGVGIRDLE